MAKPSAGGESVVPMRSELGWQVAVDLEPDADLDERWGGPDHVTSSLLCDAVLLVVVQPT
jgi:hypothetical protein